MEAYWIISSVLIILTSERDVTAHECSSSESVACKMEIEDLRQNMSRYYYVSDNQMLEEMCSKQVQAVNCVNSFAEECLSDEDQAYFKTLVLGSDAFLDTFCFKGSELKETYLKYSPCLRKVSKELDDCSQQYQVSQKELDALEEDSKTLLKRTCCIYFENIRCSANVTIETCGKEAAQLVSDLLTLLSGTYLTDRCQPYSKYEPESCTLQSRSHHLLPESITWTVLFVIYTIHQRFR